MERSSIATASPGATATAAAPSPSSVRPRLLVRYPELALFVALLLLTAFFSRAFSKGVQVGPLYVTEIVMGVAFAFAAVRLGLGGVWTALRRLPLPALGVIWFFGAVATLRGLDAFGFSMVKHDIGLIDYTLLLPLLAVLVVDRERYDAMFATLVACGFLGIAGFALTFSADQIAGDADSLFGLQGLAAGLYISFAVSWIAARVVNGVPTSRWLSALIPVGLLLMALTSQRSVWLVAIGALAVVVALAPRSMRVRTGLAGAALMAVAFVAAIGVQEGLNSTLGGVGKRTGTDGSQLSMEVTGLSGEGDSESANNVRWRLAYWGELAGRIPSDPLLGVGFGEPAAFLWEGRKYDFRDGMPATPTHPDSKQNVAGPHNSFISWVYRMGIPALVALLYLFFLAGRNVWRELRRDGLPVEDRVALTTLAAMLAAATMSSSFNEALTGPFIGLFFWVPLGMLLLWPAVRGRGRSPAPS